VQSAERAREKVASHDSASESYDAIAAVMEKAAFLLRFAGMTKIHQRLEVIAYCICSFLQLICLV